MNNLAKKRNFNTLALYFLLFFTFPFGLDALANLFIHFEDFLPTIISQDLTGWLIFLSNFIYPFYVGWSFLLIGIIVFVNYNDLKNMSIDDAFWGIYLVGSVSYAIYNFWPSGWLVIPWSLIMCFYFWEKGIIFKNFRPDINKNTRIIVPVVMLAFCVGLLSIYPTLTESKIKLAEIVFITRFPFILVEEFIFRGFSGLVFKYWRWNELQILFVQIILFWFIHASRVFSDPIYFWIYVPLSSISLGIIAWRCKSITPSFITHLLLNMFAALI